MKTTHRTQAQKDLNFTKQQGLDIQQQHLKEFKSVMSVPAFEKLEQFVTATNKDAVDGFDVVRGSEIDCIFHSQVIPLFRL
jgi:hypothetical protein